MGTKNVNGLIVNWMLSSIQIISNQDGNLQVLAQYEYGPDYLLNEKTGSMQYTLTPIDLACELADSLDIDGIPDCKDTYNRCKVCDTPCAYDTCSTDCTLAWVDTDDNYGD